MDLKKITIGQVINLLFVGFVVFYFINKNIQDKRFDEKINKIEDGRKALEQTVKDLKSSTEDRDKKLREQLKESLVIIDTLNASLKKYNKEAGEIDIKISNTKKTIDELWDDN